MWMVQKKMRKRMNKEQDAVDMVEQDAVDMVDLMVKDNCMG